MALICALILTPACSSARVTDANGKTTGYVWYDPKPYLLVKRSAGKSKAILESSVVILPDLSKPQYAVHQAGLGKGNLTVKTMNGVLTEFSTGSTDRIPDSIGKLSEKFKAFAEYELTAREARDTLRKELAEARAATSSESEKGEVAEKLESELSSRMLSLDSQVVIPIDLASRLRPAVNNVLQVPAQRQVTFGELYESYRGEESLQGLVNRYGRVFFDRVRNQKPGALWVPRFSDGEKTSVLDDWALPDTDDEAKRAVIETVRKDDGFGEAMARFVMYVSIRGPMDALRSALESYQECATSNVPVGKKCDGPYESVRSKATTARSAVRLARLRDGISLYEMARLEALQDSVDEVLSEFPKKKPGATKEEKLGEVVITYELYELIVCNGRVTEMRRVCPDEVYRLIECAACAPQFSDFVPDASAETAEPAAESPVPEPGSVRTYPIGSGG